MCGVLSHFIHGTIRKIAITLGLKTLVVSAMVHRFNRSGHTDCELGVAASLVDYHTRCVCNFGVVVPVSVSSS